MRKHRSYKFTNKQHSKGGVRSSIAAAVALVCTIISVYIAYAAKGEAGKCLALFGVLGICSSFYGLIVGKQSFREEECYYLFSRIGTIVNLVLAVFWIGIVAMGYLI